MNKYLNAYTSCVLPDETNDALKQQMRAFGIEEQYIALADACLK